MIIPMTPKGSPLSNRSVQRTCGKKNAADCTLLRTTRLLSGDRFAVIHRGNRTSRKFLLIVGTYFMYVRKAA